MLCLPSALPRSARAALLACAAALVLLVPAASAQTTAATGTPPAAATAAQPLRTPGRAVAPNATPTVGGAVEAPTVIAPPAPFATAGTGQSASGGPPSPAPVEAALAIILVVGAALIVWRMGKGGNR